MTPQLFDVFLLLVTVALLLSFCPDRTKRIVAILFGPEGIDDVIDGWDEVSGTKARDIAYWDAIAALNTPTESCR